MRNPRNHPHENKVAVVKFPNAVKPPIKLFQFTALEPYEVEMVSDPRDPRLFSEKSARDCARFIVESFQHDWILEDGLPYKYPFAYEKVIVEKFVDGKGLMTDPKHIQAGCPQSWPGCIRRQTTYSVPRNDERLFDRIGVPLEAESHILVDTRSKQFHCPIVDGEKESWDEASCLMNLHLALPEARPHRDLRYPVQGNRLRAGILVSGGIAPGINAVIEGIVQRHELYARFWEEWNEQVLHLEIRGFLNGLRGLERGEYSILSGHGRKLDLKDSAGKGGSVIGTSRLKKLIEFDSVEGQKESNKELDELVDYIAKGPNSLDILYIIGGDGSMRAAHAIHSRVEAKREREPARYRDVSVVGIPKAMDNDILWVWQAFGFMSAVETVRNLVYNLHTEASSNPRLGIIQVFGSNSGFVVSHAALASGVCDLALIPEVPFTMKEVSEHICARLKERLEKDGPNGAYALVLMAEIAIPEDVEEFLASNLNNLDEEEIEAVKKYVRGKRQLRGETPDALRRAGLKIIKRILEHEIRSMDDEFWTDYRVFTNEPRHLVRSIEPSTSDIIFGQRLGALAVDNTMAGYTDFMISQWLTEFVLVPLPLVVLGRKRVPPEGIFWKSVLARTGQPRRNHSTNLVTAERAVVSGGDTKDAVPKKNSAAEAS